MNITINITEPIKRVQEFREYDLGQITTTLQDLLDNSSITIESNIIPILKVLSVDNIIKNYLIKDLTENLYNTQDYITGQDLTEDDLILFVSESQILDLQNKLEDALIIQQSTFMGTAEPAATPTGTGNRYWTAVSPGTYTNFGGVVVAANSLAIISVTVAGVYSISQTPFDLSAYALNSDLIPIQESVFNEDITEESKGVLDLRGAYSGGTVTNGNIYFTGATGFTTSGVVLSVSILANNANVAPALVPLVHFRKGVDNIYREVDRYNITLPVGEVISVHDLQKFAINVIAEDFFGIIKTANVTVRTKAGSYNYTTLAPNGLGPWEITAAQALGLVAGNGMSFNVTIGSDYENNIYGLIGKTDSLEDELVVVNEEIEVLKEAIEATTTTIGSNRATTNPTANFTVAYLLPNLEGLVVNPAKVKSAKFTSAGSGTAYLVHMRKTGPNTWTELTRYALTIAITGEQNIDLQSLNIETIVDDTFALYSTVVSFRYLTTATGYAFFAVTQTGGIFSFTRSGYPSVASNNIALDFSMELIDPTIKERLEVLESEITTFSNADNRGTLLHNNSFSASIPTDYTNNNWALVSGGISATANGLTNFIKLNKQYSIEKRSVRVIVRFALTSRFMLHTRFQEGNVNLGTISEVDVATGQLRIYQAYDGTNLPAVSTFIAATILTDRDYIVELLLDKNTFTHKISITDTLTGVAQFLSDTTKNAGRQHDNYAMCNYSGTSPVVRSLQVFTPIKKGCYLIAMGDSINEAMGNGVDAVDGFAQRLIAACDNNGAVSGRGGGNILGVLNRLDTEINFIRPTWVSIMIGTNGGNTLPLLRQMVEKAQSMGCKVLLNNIPMRGNLDISTVNVNMATIRGEYSISGAKMDVATSLNNDIIQGYDPAKFYPDLVHPVLFGQSFMFQRFYIDTPEILY